MSSGHLKLALLVDQLSDCVPTLMTAPYGAVQPVLNATPNSSTVHRIFAPGSITYAATTIQSGTTWASVGEAGVDEAYCARNRDANR